MKISISCKFGDSIVGKVRILDNLKSRNSIYSIMVETPNLEQAKAICHIGSPLLIVAGPGREKIFVIVERILHLVKNGLKPSKIL